MNWVAAHSRFRIEPELLPKGQKGVSSFAPTLGC